MIGPRAYLTFAMDEIPLYTAIKEAIMSDDIDNLRSLLTYYNNRSQQQNKCLLNLAVTKGKLKALKCLLEKGPFDNWYPCDIWSTPLTKACDRQDEAMVKLLLDRGSNFIGQAPMLQPMKILTQKDNVHLMKILLRYGGDPFAEIDKQTCSAFMIAAKNNRLSMLKLFLETNLSKWPKSGTTPLHLPPILENKQVLELILKAGVKVDAKDSLGYTPLHRACLLGELDAFELLLSFGSNVHVLSKEGESSLTAAIAGSNLKILEKLFNLGFKASDRDQTGMTAFHHAALDRQPNVIGLLVERQARQLAASQGAARCTIATIINLASDDGWTALHCATHWSPRCWLDTNDFARTIRVINLLLVHGADVNSVDKNRRTPLHVHCQLGQINSTIVDTLIGYGADLDARDSRGFTPLLLSAYCGSDKSIKLLIDKGADIDIQDNDGNTAIHIAYDLEHSLGTSKLLAAGADLTIANKEGYSVANYVVQTYYSEEDDSNYLDEDIDDLEGNGYFDGYEYYEDEFGDGFVYEVRWHWYEPLQLRIIELQVAGLLTGQDLFRNFEDSQYGERDVAGLPYIDFGPEFDNKKAACQAEIKQLKGALLRPGLSVYDWLTRYKLREPLYTRNSQLVEKLESLNLIVYPNYSFIIQDCLRKDKLKLAFIEEAKSSLVLLIKLHNLSNEAVCLPNLPPEISEKILASLSYSNIRTFIKAVNELDHNIRHYL